MINQVTLVGRLTKDPELKMTAEGIPHTQITLAMTRSFKNQNGQIDTDFVQCTLWRRVAENTAQYCQKGSVIGVTGRIQTRNYENVEGKRIFVTEVIAESVQFLGKKQAYEKDQIPQPNSNSHTNQGSSSQAQEPLARNQGSLSGAQEPLARNQGSLSGAQEPLARNQGSLPQAQEKLAQNQGSHSQNLMPPLPTHERSQREASSLG